MVYSKCGVGYILSQETLCTGAYCSETSVTSVTVKRYLCVFTSAVPVKYSKVFSLNSVVVYRCMGDCVRVCASMQSWGPTHTITCHPASDLRLAVWDRGSTAALPPPSSLTPTPGFGCSLVSPRGAINTFSAGPQQMTASVTDLRTVCWALLTAGRRSVNYSISAMPAVGYL